MLTKKPNVESAAVTARVISRKLRAVGMKMADTSDRYNWTEGVHVRRIGYGSSVAIDYHMPTARFHSPESREVRLAARDKIVELLTSWGYEIRTPGIYVECKSE